MKRLILILSLLILPGCTIDPDVESTEGTGYYTTCIDGVFYLVRKAGYSGYMAPYLYPDGKPHTCGE